MKDFFIKSVIEFISNLKYVYEHTYSPIWAFMKEEQKMKKLVNAANETTLDDLVVYLTFIGIVIFYYILGPIRLLKKTLTFYIITLNYSIHSIYVLYSFFFDIIGVTAGPDYYQIFMDTATKTFNYTLVGVILSALTSYLYFVISIYYFNDQTLIPKYGKFLFFLVITEISLFFTFLTSNFFVFYILFEFILIPFFFIIVIWGSRDSRINAAFRLVFFTLAFSAPLTAVIAANFYYNFFSFDFNMLFATLSANSIMLQALFYLSAFMAFAVKIPLFTAHVWLPEAHGEAPTFGSVLLAGILLKLGGYGFYQVFYEFINPVWNISIINYFTLFYVISAITIIYSNIIVFTQLDIKRTIAYYSIGHIGFVTLGLITNTVEGYCGAIITIISHGLSAAGLFFCVGYLYEQTHTRSIIAYRGLSTVAPYFATVFFFFICANSSFPGTANFIGEQLVILGLSKLESPSLLILPIIGILISGFSNFILIIRILFGPVSETLIGFHQPNNFKKSALIALLLPLFVIGFFPNYIVQLLTTNILS
jgi:proton-translocating NADH-quinone oxidoreductase chain M